MEEGPRADTFGLFSVPPCLLRVGKGGDRSKFQCGLTVNLLVAPLPLALIAVGMHGEHCERLAKNQNVSM